MDTLAAAANALARSPRNVVRTTGALDLAGAVTEDDEAAHKDEVDLEIAAAHAEDEARVVVGGDDDDEACSEDEGGLTVHLSLGKRGGSFGRLATMTPAPEPGPRSAKVLLMNQKWPARPLVPNYWAQTTPKTKSVRQGVIEYR